MLRKHINNITLDNPKQHDLCGIKAIYMVKVRL